MSTEPHPGCPKPGAGPSVPRAGLDLVVVGGGQAGLAAGAAAAERGLRVVVCEKTSRRGGSAHFSAGILRAVEAVVSDKEENDGP